MPTLDWLREQAERASCSFKDAVDSGTASLRNTTEHTLLQSGILGKEKRRLRQSYLPYLHEVGDLKRYVLLVVGSAVGVSNPPPESELWDWTVSECDRLRSRYNGSIDVYLDVYERYIATAWSGKTAAHNDLFDLDHFVYMRSGDNAQAFVTADQKLLDLAAPVLPNRILDLAAFRRAVA